MSDFAVQVKDLRKSFKDTEVLKGVDFAVAHVLTSLVAGMMTLL